MLTSHNVKAVNVISRKKLKEFVASDLARKQHEGAFTDWYKLARKARWHSFQDTKATFGQTDVANFDSGRTATVFDVGGNKYRLITHIDYTRQTVLIVAVVTHKEYDRGSWKKLF